MKQFLTCCILLVSVFSLDAKGFKDLDMDMEANWRDASQMDFKDWLIKMEGMVYDQESKAIFNYYQGIYHYTGFRYDTAFSALKKGAEGFWKVKEFGRALDCQLYMAYSLRDLGKMEEAKKLATKILAELSWVEYPSIEHAVYYLRGSINGMTGVLEQAELDFERSVDLCKQIGDSLDLGISLNAIMIVNLQNGKLKKALLAGKEAEVVLERNGNAHGLANYYNVIGNIYGALEIQDSCKMAFEQALEIATRHNIRSERASALSNLGAIMVERGDSLAAIDYFIEAMEIFIEINLADGLVSISENIATLYDGSGYFDKAVKYYQISLNYAIEFDNLKGQVVALGRLGKMCLEAKKFVKSKEWLENALAKAELLKDWYWLSLVQETLSQTYEKLGEVELALEMQRASGISKDSLEKKEAIMYVDSLRLSQPIIINNSLGKNKTNYWWLLLILIIPVVWRLVARNNSSTVGERTDSERIKMALESLKKDKDWAAFMLQFDLIYPDLLPRLGNKHPGITPTDLRVLSLTRIGLSSSEISEFMAITPESAKKARQRTRKRLGLSRETSLLQYLLGL